MRNIRAARNLSIVSLIIGALLLILAVVATVWIVVTVSDPKNCTGGASIPSLWVGASLLAVFAGIAALPFAIVGIILGVVSLTRGTSFRTGAIFGIISSALALAIPGITLLTGFWTCV